MKRTKINSSIFSTSHLRKEKLITESNGAHQLHLHRKEFRSENSNYPQKVKIPI